MAEISRGTKLLVKGEMNSYTVVNLRAASAFVKQGAAAQMQEPKEAL